MKEVIVVGNAVVEQIEKYLVVIALLYSSSYEERSKLGMRYSSGRRSVSYCTRIVKSSYGGLVSVIGYAIEHPPL